jgi:hypothetical protein
VSERVEALDHAPDGAFAPGRWQGLERGGTPRVGRLDTPLVLRLGLGLSLALSRRLALQAREVLRHQGEPGRVGGGRRDHRLQAADGIGDVALELGRPGQVELRLGDLTVEVDRALEDRLGLG